MFNDNWGLSWDECVERFQRYISHFEESKRKSPDKYKNTVAGSFDWHEALPPMIELIEQLRVDPDIPELRLLISHITLRLWPASVAQLEVHVTPIRPSEYFIGLSGYEEVSVPPDRMTVTVKHYLRQAQTLAAIYNTVEKDEIGELERELETLPLEWVAPAALYQIFEKALKFSRYKYTLKDGVQLPLETVQELIDTGEEISHIVLKAQDIAREKRSKQWIAELRENDDKSETINS